MHAFEHVAVANVGTVQDDAHVIERPLQTEVGHFGADDVVQLFAFEGAVFGDDVEDGIAVAQSSVMVNHHHAVTVAVESDTGIGLFVAHATLQGFRRG